MLAGMNVAAGPKLAAAVTNAGGLGVIGGVGYTPDMLREQIAELKSFLKDKHWIRLFHCQRKKQLRSQSVSPKH